MTATETPSFAIFNVCLPTKTLFGRFIFLKKNMKIVDGVSKDMFKDSAMHAICSFYNGLVVGDKNKNSGWSKQGYV